ncbi:MAG: hypothetical protein QM692_16315 [Thermomicrobiales bacterium]
MTQSPATQSPVQQSARAAHDPPASLQVKARQVQSYGVAQPQGPSQHSASPVLHVLPVVLQPSAVQVSGPPGRTARHFPWQQSASLLQVSPPPTWQMGYGWRQVQLAGWKSTR